ncbi:hypothetical protein MOK15_16235 [Sphingobium sp. BYY-5]|nr:hypothetical protein [Sphingobium sp. BYY-5]
MDEHVLTAIVANDEAETLLAVEEFDDALAFADNLGRHPATTAAETTASTGTTAEAAAACAAAKTTTTACAAAAAAEAITTAAETAAEATTITTEATAAALIVEIVVAETVALVLAAPAAATSIKTHALLVTFASPQDKSDKHVGRMTCRIHRKGAVWESLYQLFRTARMIFTVAIPFRSAAAK